MPRPLSRPLTLTLPPTPDPDNLPQHGTAELCASLHTHYFGPISARVIREQWPLEWRIVNGRGNTSIRTFLSVAQRRFDAAPVVQGGVRDKVRAPHANQAAA